MTFDDIVDLAEKAGCDVSAIDGREYQTMWCDSYQLERFSAALIQSGAASRDAYIEQLELALLQVRKAICGDIHNTDDLLDLIASRDAEVARLKTVPMRYRRMAFNAQLQDEVARLEQENDQLRAQINVLREAVKVVEADSEEVLDFDECMAMCLPMDAYHGLIEAAEATPEQSLAEYRNKVIEAFVNEFSRHVGGDGEFWLHELQDFAMKEQP